jgi:phosphoglucosamine mutase
MSALFGTDGIRAEAGEFPLDEASLLGLGEALARLLKDEGLPARLLIGRDTRESGAWIERTIVRAFRRAGGEAVSAGVIPTSAVAYLTTRRAFSAGLVISASHNPYRDNGIKIFSAAGFKIPEAWEARLEGEILGRSPAPGPGDGDLEPDPTLLEDYEKQLTAAASIEPGRRPLKIVLDCANGSGSLAAPRVMRALGFDVAALSCAPNGRNINESCGSLHPERLARAVVDREADLGIAYDGDADRALWVDERGRVLTGDHTLYILSRAMLGAGRLKAGAVVATTMSNMGLEKSVGEMGLRLERTRVGDKYVLERMLELGANLGGERSGHTILLDEATTGDGLLTGLKILEVLASAERPFSELVAGYREFPQILRNVPVPRKPTLRDIPEIAAAIDETERTLVGRGRLDVRYSGTEPLARVMVEGEDAAEIEELARRVAETISRNVG